MKKICHITSVHPRYDARILKKECASLAREGYDVTLLCCDNKENEVCEGVKIVSVSFRPKNRLERILRSTKVLFKAAMGLECDVYHLHDPELLKLGMKLKKAKKAVIFDSHEDVLVSIKDKKWIPRLLRGMATKFYKRREDKALKKFDGVISVTPIIVDRLKKINPNTVMVTNFPIISPLLDLPKESIVSFAGGICSHWLHPNMIKAISKFDGKIRYSLAGNNNSPYFEELKKIEGFEYVNVLGKISLEEVNSLYAKSLMGLAIIEFTANIGYKEGTLGVIKIFEMMQAGIPVIATNTKIWREIIERNHAGICVDPHDVDAIANAIEYILNNPEEAKRMGQNGRRIVEEKYNWSTQEKVLLDFYKEI